MITRAIALLDKAIGLSGGSERAETLMAETLSAFFPRMPWLYAILMVNLSGLLVSLRGPFTTFTAGGVLILLVLALRLVHWTRLPGRKQSRAQIANELRNVFLIGVLACVAYCSWLFGLYLRSTTDDRNHIVLFGSLAALGCSFALSPLPSVAKVPLLLLALPLAILLISTAEIAFVGMGLTLLTLIFVANRLIDVQSGTFRRLVNSRLDVEMEKRRAENAERSAIRERSTARKLADTDPLTGLPNRRALLSKLELSSRGNINRFAVALIDLDGFKPINDTFGHVTGDALLIEVSRRLQSVVESIGLVARLGGDEFALLLEDCGEKDVQAVVAEAIAEISQPYVHEGRTLCVSACAGIACGEPDAIDPTKSIRMADIALFSAKRQGRGLLELYSGSIETEVARRAEIELALRAPGVERDIDLAFQPILDLKTMEVRSFEALARWSHSELGWISPSEFIPISEQISLVELLTRSLLRRAAAEAFSWPQSILLSFNLSAVELCSEGSAEQILDLVRTEGLAPSRLQIEVTETAILADFDAARRNLAKLRREGVILVLDDFGAGYASISYLREMKFDAVKLDGSLLTAATPERGGLPLFRGVVDLCRAVSLPCVAEHVESEAQVAMLRELGCEFGQGYWLAPPMSAESARQLLTSSIVPFGPARLLRQHWIDVDARSVLHH
jgi:diguanylate cyclase (GGDEF)-like protein